jgi:uncharacterized membrane protein
VDLNKEVKSKRGQYIIIGAIVGAALGLMVGNVLTGLIIGGVAGFLVSRLKKSPKI